MISVLCVDDEPELLDVIKLHLEQTRLFRVDTLGSAKNALQKLKEKEYDGVVSDYQMPEMDGIEFLKAVREEYPHLPFIIFTGRGREEVVIDALNNGADYYLQKGTEIKAIFAELRNIIQKAVERRHIEVALFASEERYRNVVQTQTEFITRFLPDGTHIFVNDAYCQYFGKTLEEMIGHRFVPNIPEEDLPQVHKHFSSLTRENPIGSIEHRIIMPDGGVRWQIWNDRAIFNEKGVLMEYQSVGRDITKRKDAEKALRESERLYKVLYRDNPSMYFMLDTNGTIISVNQFGAQQLGYSVEELEGHSVLEVFHEEDRPAVIESLEMCLASPSKLHYWQFRKVRKDGSVIWVEENARAIFESGSDIRVLVVCQDITDRIRIEEALRNSEQLNRGIIDHLPDALFVVANKGNVMVWNQAMEELTGIPASEIIGKGNYEYAIPFYGKRRPVLIDLVFRDDEEVRKMYSFIRREGETLIAETPSAHPQGKSVMLWGKASPLYDRNGMIIGAIETVRVISDIKQS